MATIPDQPPRTLVVDCGGTGIKAAVLDPEGAPVSTRFKMRTLYPSPPDVLLQAISDLAAMTLTEYDRATIGFPGMVRDGIVHATPHYVTESGPFTPRRADLEKEWAGFDVQAALTEVLGCPTRVLNDAEVAGLAVITGTGFEVMLTLGTGLGCALYESGRVLPKVEMSHAPFRAGETYDEQLGHHARELVGIERWNERVYAAVESLRPVLWWDRVFVGGGGAKHLTVDLGPDVTLVTNESGMLGGVRVWESRTTGDESGLDSSAAPR